MNKFSFVLEDVPGLSLDKVIPGPWKFTEGW